jgi:hypothetical protein
MTMGTIMHMGTATRGEPIPEHVGKSLGDSQSCLGETRATRRDRYCNGDDEREPSVDRTRGDTPRSLR